MPKGTNEPLEGNEDEDELGFENPASPEFEERFVDLLGA